jgi:hypothetical protein
VVISQVKTSGPGDGGVNHQDEFIEIYNPLTIDVDLNGFKLQYKSATGTTWKDLAVFSGKTIGAGKFLLVASDAAQLGNVTPDITYSSSQLGLAVSGGNVRIIDASSNVVDMVAWGNGDSPEGKTVAPPVIGGSIIIKARADSTAESMKSGGADEKSGHGYDTDNNANDFVLLDIAEPNNSASDPEPSVCVE